MRMGPSIRPYRETLGDGLEPAGHAILTLMLGFYAWRSLVRENGLEPDTAVEAAARAVEAADKGQSADRADDVPP